MIVFTAGVSCSLKIQILHVTQKALPCGLSVSQRQKKMKLFMAIVGHHQQCWCRGCTEWRKEAGLARSLPGTFVTELQKSDTNNVER